MSFLKIFGIGREKPKSETKSTETQFGTFTILAGSPEGSDWSRFFPHPFLADEDEGLLVDIPDLNGAPDPRHLARIPGTLERLAEYVHVGNAHRHSGGYVTEEYLSEMEFSNEPDNDLILWFKNGDDDTSVGVHFLNGVCQGCSTIG